MSTGHAIRAIHAVSIHFHASHSMGSHCMHSQAKACHNSIIGPRHCDCTDSSLHTTDARIDDKCHTRAVVNTQRPKRHTKSLLTHSIPPHHCTSITHPYPLYHRINRPSHRYSLEPLDSSPSSPTLSSCVTVCLTATCPPLPTRQRAAVAAQLAAWPATSASTLR